MSDADRHAEYVVRRLTPVECERLQGFPDGWTDIGGTEEPEWQYCDADDEGAELFYYDEDDGHPVYHRLVSVKCTATPDTRRYKQMGNSMAVPVMRMIGRRIEAFDILHGDEVGMPPHALFGGEL